MNVINHLLGKLALVIDPVAIFFGVALLAIALVNGSFIQIKELIIFLKKKRHVISG